MKKERKLTEHIPNIVKILAIIILWLSALVLGNIIWAYSLLIAGEFSGFFITAWAYIPVFGGILLYPIVALISMGVAFLLAIMRLNHPIRYGILTAILVYLIAWIIAYFLGVLYDL